MFFHISIFSDDNRPFVNACVGPIYDLEWCIKRACERIIERYPEYAGREAAICKDLREEDCFYPDNPDNPDGDDGWSLHIIAAIKDTGTPV